jgi:hypothetical protein
MKLLSFTWLVLVMVEIVLGGTRLLEVFDTIIWIVFIFGFALGLSLAPNKTVFATFFIGQEAGAKESDVAGSGDIAELRDEIARLRAELQSHPSSQEAR